MEKDQEKLKQHLIQLRKEIVYIKQLLHDSNATIKECVKGFKTISETGNTRVADIFLDELLDELKE